MTPTPQRVPGSCIEERYGPSLSTGCRGHSCHTGYPSACEQPVVSLTHPHTHTTASYGHRHPPHMATQPVPGRAGLGDLCPPPSLGKRKTLHLHMQFLGQICRVSNNSSREAYLHGAIPASAQHAQPQRCCHCRDLRAEWWGGSCQPRFVVRKQRFASHLSDLPDTCLVDPACALRLKH